MENFPKSEKHRIIKELLGIRTFNRVACGDMVYATSSMINKPAEAFNLIKGKGYSVVRKFKGILCGQEYLVIKSDFQGREFPYLFKFFV
jgi:hypothetical protein